VGLRAGLDEFGKSRLPPGFDPRTVQSYRVAIPTEEPKTWSLSLSLSFCLQEGHTFMVCDNRLLTRKRK